MGVAGELSCAFLPIWFQCFSAGGWEGTVDYMVGRFFFSPIMCDYSKHYRMLGIFGFGELNASSICQLLRRQLERSLHISVHL